MKKIKSLLKPTILALAIALIGSFTMANESKAMSLVEICPPAGCVPSSSGSRVTAVYRNSQGEEVSFEVDFHAKYGDFDFIDSDENGVIEAGDHVTGLTWQVKD